MTGPSKSKKQRALIRSVWSPARAGPGRPGLAGRPADRGKRLIDALKDEEIQDLAWREHGFRSPLTGVTQDPSAHGIDMIAQRIDSVMPLPTAHAMDRIVEALTP